MSEAIHLSDAEQQSIHSLQAEIDRMAEMVFDVARETGLQAVTAALSLAAEGRPGAPDHVRDVANDLLCRAEIMQSEIGRFMSVAEHAQIIDLEQKQSR